MLVLLALPAISCYAMSCSRPGKWYGIIFQILGILHLLSGLFLVVRVQRLVLAGPPRSNEFWIWIPKTGAILGEAYNEKAFIL